MQISRRKLNNDESVETDGSANFSSSSCEVATDINQSIAQEMKLMGNNRQPSHGRFVKIAEITQTS